MTAPTRAAVFLDRDGTLIEDTGYVREPAEMKWFPETVQALRLLAEHFRLFLVTNQPGIARGALRAEEVARVNGHLVEVLARQGVTIEAVYVCPHERQERCTCIKPEPHFLHRAARDHAVDLTRSFVVGDHPHDVAFAVNGGARGIYLLSGHGELHRGELSGLEAAVVPGILDAARWILASTWQGLSAAADVERAAGILRAGGLVAFPTETVYGLGAHALAPQAVARVFEAKGRPRFDPLIVHLADSGWIDELAVAIPAEARSLAARFWPGPLTLVLPKRQIVPDIVTAGLPTVAVRVPDHPVALDLLGRTGGPVAAPSANPFGRVSPTRAEHVVEQLAGEVDMILDGGPCRVGVESTIVSFTEGHPRLLRPGGIPVEELEEMLGPLSGPGPDGPRPQAPGRLPSHYAPKTPLRLTPFGLLPPGVCRAGLLALRRPLHPNGYAALEVLSEAGDLREAAANLFAALRRLDALGLECIVAEPLPEVGLGRAIMDRLRRPEARTPGRTSCR